MATNQGKGFSLAPSFLIPHFPHLPSDISMTKLMLDFVRRLEVTRGKYASQTFRETPRRVCLRNVLVKSIFDHCFLCYLPSLSSMDNGPPVSSFLTFPQASLGITGLSVHKWSLSCRRMLTKCIFYKYKHCHLFIFLIVLPLWSAKSSTSSWHFALLIIFKLYMLL